METNSVIVALLSVVGTLIAGLLTILITMIVGLKNDNEKRDLAINEKIDAIQARLSHMVLVEDYREDKEKIHVKLDDHGERILVLEIKVKKSGVKIREDLDDD